MTFKKTRPWLNIALLSVLIAVVSLTIIDTTHPNYKLVVWVDVGAIFVSFLAVINGIQKSIIFEKNNGND